MGLHDLLVATRPAAPIDLDDDRAVRDWIRAEVEARGFAAAEPTLWFLADDRSEIVEAPEPVHRERVLSFAYARLSSRSDVRRSFWVGDARVAVAGGRRRAVCVLERAPDGAWWSSWRLVRYDAATRTSALVGPWEEASGAPHVPLEPPFDAWVGPALLAPDAAPDVRVGSGVLNEELPERAAALLDGVARLLYAQIAEEGGLDCDLVAVFQGRDFRLWEIRGGLPAPFDDLVRTVARGADAVVVLRPELASADELQILATAERGRDRAAHRLTLRREGARFLGSGIRAIDADDRRWLGVLPQTPIELRGEVETGWAAILGDA